MANKKDPRDDRLTRSTALSNAACLPVPPFTAFGELVLMLSRRADQATFPRAVFVTDHRRSISFKAIFMLGRYFRAATSGVIDDEKKIRLRLPRTGPPPEIANAMALMPVSDPPTDDA